MTAYLAESFFVQPDRQKPLGGIAAWFQRWAEARRQRRQAREVFEELRALDPRQLADFGVDAASLGTPPIRLAEVNPYAVAVRALSPRPF